MSNNEDRKALAIRLGIKSGDMVSRFTCEYTKELVAVDADQCLIHDAVSPYHFEFGEHRPCFKATLDDKLALTVTQFLWDRVHESRKMAENSVLDEDYTKLADIIDIILRWHNTWPVLVETPPVFEDAEDMATTTDMIAFRVTQQLDWLTTQEFKKRFGKDAPTAPLIRQIAQMWDTHPDFCEEWRVG